MTNVIVLKENKEGVFARNQTILERMNNMKKSVTERINNFKKGCTIKNTYQAFEEVKEMSRTAIEKTKDFIKRHWKKALLSATTLFAAATVTSGLSSAVLVSSAVYAGLSTAYRIYKKEEFSNGTILHDFGVSFLLNFAVGYMTITGGVPILNAYIALEESFLESIVSTWSFLAMLLIG